MKEALGKIAVASAQRLCRNYQELGVDLRWEGNHIPFQAFLAERLFSQVEHEVPDHLRSFYLAGLLSWHILSEHPLFCDDDNARLRANAEYSLLTGILLILTCKESLGTNRPPQNRAHLYTKAHRFLLAKQDSVNKIILHNSSEGAFNPLLQTAFFRLLFKTTKFSKRLPVQEELRTMYEFTRLSDNDLALLIHYFDN